MIFKYPLQAKTIKDIDRLMYRTINALGVNMNKYNHDSSNTFNIVDISAMELERAKFDLQYQFNPSLENTNFTTFDRINRYSVQSVQSIKEDIKSGVIYSESELSGYSVYTNDTYRLENVNKFTDLIRHSLPVDVFVEAQKSSFILDDILPESISLIPNIKYVFHSPRPVKNTKITISLETSNIKDILIFPAPLIKISGYDYEYKAKEEIVAINSPLGIITKTEFSSITSVLLTGTSSSLTVKIYPVVKSLYSTLLHNYIDREEQYEFESIYSIDKSMNKLIINRLDPTFSTPPSLDGLEEFLLDIEDGYNILDYYLDQPNHLLYTIIYNNTLDKKLVVYPIYIPQKREKLGQLINTESQNVKVTYSRDTITKKYILTIYPASIQHGVDSVNISIKHLSKNERGSWNPSTQYYKGDLFYYAGEFFIATEDHISTQYFDIDKTTPQIEYITQDLILDLILHGIESNSIEISFDKLFRVGSESIIQIDISGFENCTTQILAQYNKVEKLFSKTFGDLFSFRSHAPTGQIVPISNQENTLLVNKINSYNYKNYTQDISGTGFFIYSLSSTNKLYINGYSLVNVFNTFYLDWPTKTIITSDTITQIAR